MAIEKVQLLRASAGWKHHSFVKISSEIGVAGWGELSHPFAGGGAARCPRIFHEISEQLVGAEMDEAIAHLAERRSESWTEQQTLGGMTNALLDLSARSRDVPVRDLFGPMRRDGIPVYWSHCGTYRVSDANLIRKPPIRTVDDLVELGAEVSRRGFRALKTNVLIVENGSAYRYKPSDPDHASMPIGLVRESLGAQLAALRQGAGNDVQIMVDLGAGLNDQDVLLVAEVMEQFGVAWLELEGPVSLLRDVRSRTSVPVASGERLSLSDYRALLEADAVDVGIVDVPFNGLTNALAIADLCAARGLDVAPHNCYSPLASAISAAFSSLVPNLRIMEIDVDEVPWEYDFVTVRPRIEDGCFELPHGAGWGTEIVEATLAAHPDE